MGRGLPHEEVGAKKFGMSLETKEINFFGGISRDFAGISRRNPENLRKEIVLNVWPLFKALQTKGNQIFWAGYPGILLGYRSRARKLEKKNCVAFLAPYLRLNIALKGCFEPCFKGYFLSPLKHNLIGARDLGSAEGGHPDLFRFPGLLPNCSDFRSLFSGIPCMCHHRDTWDNLRVASPPLPASARYVFPFDWPFWLKRVPREHTALVVDLLFSCAGVVSDTSRKALESRKNTVNAALACVSETECPLTAEALEKLAARFRTAGYRSGFQYLLAAKRERIELGHRWTEQLALKLQGCRRGLERGIGPPQRAAEIRLHVVAWAPEDMEPKSATGPLFPKRAWFVACWWVLREIELANVRMRDVEVLASG